jgi:Cyclic nucleotide-binding domain
MAKGGSEPGVAVKPPPPMPRARPRPVRPPGSFFTVRRNIAQALEDRAIICLHLCGQVQQAPTVVGVGLKESKKKATFDPRAFLSKVGRGRTIAKYRKNKIIFSQGEAADSVFFIEGGKVKVAVVSEQGKEAVIAILGTGQF